MGFRESWNNVVRAVTDMTTGRKNATPDKGRTASTSPAPAERPSGIYAVAAPTPATQERPVSRVKNHRQLAREREQAAAKVEKQKNTYKNQTPEQLNQAAVEILGDLQQISSALPEQTRNYIQGYQNQYDKLVTTQLDNVRHDAESIKKNTERISKLKPIHQEVANDVERLRNPRPTQQDQADAQLILELCQRHGMPINRKADQPFSVKDKLQVVEALRGRMAAKQETSLPVTMLFTKLRKQQEEDGIFEGTLQNMERRRDTAAKEIQTLTEQNQVIQRRIAFIQGEMADFVGEIDRFRNGIAERTSVPPQAE